MTTEAPAPETRIAKALEFASEYGTIDGDHHKMTIDQMVRALTGCPVVTKSGVDYKSVPYTYEAQGESPEYEAFIGGEGWDEGIAP
jgi:hypothetical protein